MRGVPPPIVLIASVSLHERRRVEAMLKPTGFTTLGVHDAREAEQELEALEGAALLVIDAGMLEANHDAQWRELRIRRPELGAVVRQVVPERTGVQRWDSRNLVVHPGDAESLRSAVDLLVAAASRPPAAIRPIRSQSGPDSEGEDTRPPRLSAGARA